MLAEGTQIGKYIIGKALGRGGMGAVYIAHDTSLEREVAIKVMNTNMHGVQNALQRFEQEAKSIARLSSPHVVHIYEFDAAGEHPFIAMELVQGMDLHTLIRDHAPLSISRTIDLSEQILKGLVAAHEAGVIHRDIKPSNMLLSRVDDIVKLTDFGLARSLEANQNLTLTGTVIGTIHYVAPEVARGEDATIKSDLYSVGVSVYEMLTGELPFQEDSPLRLLRLISTQSPKPIVQIRPDVPLPLQMWLQRLVAHDPDQRYQTSREALADLRKAAGQSSQNGIAPQEPHSEQATAVVSLHEKGEAEQPNPKPQIAQEELSAVLERALQWERNQAQQLDEERFLQIAADVGVAPDAAGEAFRQHRLSAAYRIKRRRIVRTCVLGAVAAFLLFVVLYAAFKPVRRVPRQTLNRVVTCDIGATWRATSVQATSDLPLVLIAAAGDAPVDIRVGEDGSAQSFTGYYHRMAAKPGMIYLQSDAGAVSARVSVAAPIRMAILPFSGGSKQDLAIGTAEAMATRLAQKQSYVMVERMQVDDVIGNLSLESTRFFDPKTAGEIGNLLGVEYVIQGSVLQQGDQLRMTARRVDAQSGTVIDSAQVEGSVRETFALQDRLADALHRKIIEGEIQRIIQDNKNP